MVELNQMRDLDVEELCIRVSRYGSDLRTPEAYQAIAKHRTAPGGPWGVGVRGNPEAAAAAALEEVAHHIRDGFRAAHPEIVAAAPAAPSKYGF